MAPEGMGNRQLWRLVLAPVLTPSELSGASGCLARRGLYRLIPLVKCGTIRR